jgi:glycosyltransferase involved in cell wall biosynthesis
MIRVAHIGPPLSRQGGPAGYLYQLERAACGSGAYPRNVTFPQPAPPRPPAPPTPLSRRVRAALGKAKRAVVGAAPPHRPSDESLAAYGGHVEFVMQTARESLVAESMASITAALSASPDVLFCHDPGAAAHMLERRARGQQVWLFIHSPMPLAVYLIWNWGLPERHWRDILAFPDVRTWVNWELDIYRAVDRLVLPCPEAWQEVARIAPVAATLSTPTDFVLSGASADATSRRDRESARREFGLPLDEPVGLYLGNHQAYRGLDVLIAAARTLDARAPRGVVAVAGPPASHVPKHPRLRALGHVSRVADLLAAVDFVVNVNRFSLFDLSTIEALEAGKALLLHATGGNLTFQSLGAGTQMLANLEIPVVAEGLARMFEMPKGERRDRELMSRQCYDAYLTRGHLWRAHQSLYVRRLAEVDA